MAGSDEPVHPGGLNLYFPKVAARRPPPLKIPGLPRERRDDAPRLKSTSVIRSIFSAIKAASSSGKAPGAVLESAMKLVKVAAAGPTTGEVAKALDVDTSPWLDPDVHPILLLRDLTRSYGTDWLSWEPETIWSELDDDDDLGGELPRANKDKVMALRLAVKTDLPWKHLAVFENVALAFVGMVPRFDVMQPLEPYQAALAIDVLYKIHPRIEYDDDVLGYLAAVLVHDGLSWVPPEIFGDVEPVMKTLRPNDDVADKVRDGWAAGATSDADDAVASQLQTLHALREYLALMEEQLQLTPTLPTQDYDAETDPSMPDAPVRGISAPAAGSP